MEDELRWETTDGESPSRYGCVSSLPFVIIALCIIALVVYFVYFYVIGGW